MELLHLSALGLTTWLLSYLDSPVFVSAFSFRPVHSQRLSLKSTRTANVEDTENPHIVAETLFETAEFLQVVLPEHKPLGCTAEESLASVTIELADNQKQKLEYVFFSAVKPGGNADKAGLLPGDVVVGVTGIFGELENVVGLGIDKVEITFDQQEGLVAARAEDQPLTIRVARGTTVMNDHERVLVDLCSDPTLDGKDADECIVSFLKKGYEIDDDYENDDEYEMDTVNGIFNDADITSINGSSQLDEEDLVAGMHNMWAEDMDLPVAMSSGSSLPGKIEDAPKPKPWSSRSSPSGTFVRDPRTGEMRNIDS